LRQAWIWSPRHPKTNRGGGRAAARRQLGRAVRAQLLVWLHQKSKNHRLNDLRLPFLRRGFADRCITMVIVVIALLSLFKMMLEMSVTGKKHDAEPGLSQID
jgi:hypothetical protein